MKLALLALVTIVSSSCTRTLYNHREDFQPPKAKGAWTNYYNTVKEGNPPSERPLPGERK